MPSVVSSCLSWAGASVPKQHGCKIYGSGLKAGEYDCVKCAPIVYKDYDPKCDWTGCAITCQGLYNHTKTADAKTYYKGCTDACAKYRVLYATHITGQSTVLTCMGFHLLLSSPGASVKRSTMPITDETEPRARQGNSAMAFRNNPPPLENEQVYTIEGGSKYMLSVYARSTTDTGLGDVQTEMVQYGYMGARKDGYTCSGNAAGADWLTKRVGIPLNGRKAYAHLVQYDSKTEPECDLLCLESTSCIGTTYGTYSSLKRPERNTQNKCVLCTEGTWVLPDAKKRWRWTPKQDQPVIGASPHDLTESHLHCSAAFADIIAESAWYRGLAKLHLRTSAKELRFPLGQSSNRTLMERCC